jgi:hypothetical protein
MALIKISTVLTASWDIIIPRPTERGGQPGGRLGAHEFRGPTSCFLNHNSSIHFCCTDSLLMTHRGGISLSIIIWRIGGGGAKFPFVMGPTNSLGDPNYSSPMSRVKPTFDLCLGYCVIGMHRHFELFLSCIVTML